MTTAAHAYSDEQLRAAWRACKLGSWPATFEEAMADPIRARLVRIFASTLGAGIFRLDDQRAPKPPRAPRPFTLTPPPGYVDCKRAAAGDRDD